MDGVFIAFTIPNGFQLSGTPVAGDIVLPARASFQTIQTPVLGLSAEYCYPLEIVNSSL